MSEASVPTLMEEAKKSWFETFNGPSFVMSTNIGSSLVNSFYRRTFEITSRNAHFISVFGRILLGEDKVQEPENYLKNTLANAIKEIDSKIVAAKALMLNEGIDKLASYENSRPFEVKIVSPIAKQYMELLLKADEYQAYVSTLWLHGAIDDRQRTGTELDLKKRMRSVVTAARNMFIVIRKKTNEDKGTSKVKKAEDEEGDLNVVAGKTKASSKKEAKVTEPAPTSVAVDKSAETIETPEAQAA